MDNCVAFWLPLGFDPYFTFFLFFLFFFFFFFLSEILTMRVDYIAISDGYYGTDNVYL